MAEHPVDLLRVTFAEYGHSSGYCYDLSVLSAELERAGFVNVVRVEPERSEDPAFRKLESRTEAFKAVLQLVVEAEPY